MRVGGAVDRAAWRAGLGFRPGSSAHLPAPTGQGFLKIGLVHVELLAGRGAVIDPGKDS